MQIHVYLRIVFTAKWLSQSFNSVLLEYYNHVDPGHQPWILNCHKDQTGRGSLPQVGHVKGRSE